MRKSTIAIVALFCLLGGCRTYGGHDSEVLNAELFVQLKEQVAEAASAAEGELSILEQAAARDGQLTPYVKAYRGVIERNAKLSTELEERAIPDTYRSASRAAGSVITELEILRSSYDQVKRDIATTRGQSFSMSNTRDNLSYGTVPPYFRRIDLAGDISMRDALGLN